MLLIDARQACLVRIEVVGPGSSAVLPAALIRFPGDFFPLLGITLTSDVDLYTYLRIIDLGHPAANYRIRSEEE